jgi:phosphoribosylformylglycinamidine cyclo-ligase
MKTNTTYKADGVNISTGDVISTYAKEISQSTYEISPYVKIFKNDNYFRSPVTWSLKLALENCQLFICTDGIGTKVGLHQAARTFGLAAIDLLAMLDTDCARFGGLPLILSNTLSVSSTGSHEKNASPMDRLKFTSCKMLLNGLKRVALQSGVVLLGGEIAEKGLYVGGELPMHNNLRFDWEGALTGVMHPDKMITGNDIKPGNVIIALKENGFRSNGISSVRKALALKFGEDWWNNSEAEEFIRLAAEPSVLYSKFLTTLNGWFSSDFKPVVKLNAIAHISGGGIESKLGQDILFRQGFSAKLDNLFHPAKIMYLCKEWRGMSDTESYSTWNCGQGALLILENNEESVEKVIHLANSFGIKAQVAGVVTKWKKPRIVLNSKFTKNKKITLC